MGDAEGPLTRTGWIVVDITLAGVDVEEPGRGRRVHEGHSWKRQTPLTALIVLVFLGLGGLAAYDDEPVPAVLVVVVLVVPTALLALRFYQTRRVESDADGLLVHRLLRSRKFRWDDIASIRVHKYSSQHGDFYTPTLNIKNGRSYKLSALTERSYAKAEESVNNLNDAHAGPS